METVLETEKKCPRCKRVLALDKFSKMLNGNYKVQCIKCNEKQLNPNIKRGKNRKSLSEGEGKKCSRCKVCLPFNEFGEGLKRCNQCNEVGNKRNKEHIYKCIHNVQKATCQKKVNLIRFPLNISIMPILVPIWRRTV